MKHICLPLNLKLNKKKWRVPILNEIGFNNHQMDEYWMMDLFKEMNISPTDIFFDLGANVGQSLLKWRSIFDQSPYYGFEPLSACVNYLNKLIHINQMQNCHIIDAAVCETSGRSEMYLHFDDPTDRTASLLRSSMLKVTSTRIIDCINIPEFIVQEDIKEHNIALIKIDIEGTESNILYSLKELLEKTAPLIIVEILTQNNDPSSLDRLFTYLVGLNYRCYRIIKKAQHLSTLKKIEAFEYDVSIEESDYILIPTHSRHIDISSSLRVDS